MKNPQRTVFLLAAEMISPADETFACIAIRKAHATINDKLYMDSKNCPEEVMFKELFQPEGHTCGTCWWPGDYPNFVSDYESRILALLLCAEMCETKASLLNRFWNFFERISG